MQVVVAGFEAWSEMCKHATRAQEPYLERLMSCAFLRASDSKAVIRQAVLSALNSAARGFSADTLLAALNKCLNNAKVRPWHAALVLAPLRPEHVSACR